MLFYNFIFYKVEVILKLARIIVLQLQLQHYYAQSNNSEYGQDILIGLEGLTMFTKKIQHAYYLKRT